ncbi:geranyl transferase [Endozoicomonas sp. (ex Bugula neritina AB1)]|nr:geranyl transferase [Endozoicomonas sp. (ex Bugula neritina AB1)]
MPQGSSFDLYIERCRKQLDKQLNAVLPSASAVSPRLMEAMRYSVFNGGKRIRPVLAYAACEAVGGDRLQATPASCAVELMHAYSLVHDDLPAMDDDDLRRGKPTCHKVYGEATAILVGDTLQSLAFEVLSNPLLCPDSNLPAQSRIQMVSILSQSSGLSGMAGGQAMDQLSTGLKLDQAQLELMHSHKTGALINASVRMGALCQNTVTEQQLESLEHYSQAIGLAFQVQDDILDVISDTATLGKQQGADIALDKPTYVSLMGLKAAQALASELHKTAVRALEDFPKSAIPLRQLADFIVQRSY